MYTSALLYSEDAVKLHNLLQRNIYFYSLLFQFWCIMNAFVIIESQTAL